MSNCVVSSCDEKVIVTVTEDICAQGIKLGGEADISFVKQNILPYYISKKWLTKDPPNGQKLLYGTIATIPFSSTFPGWDKERENIISKCYNPTYNYCNPDHRKKSVDCLKDSNLATILMVSVMD